MNGRTTPRHFDVSSPNAVRINNCLGGKDNFEVDRRAADAALACPPWGVIWARRRQPALDPIYQAIFVEAINVKVRVLAHSA